MKVSVPCIGKIGALGMEAVEFGNFDSRVERSQGKFRPCGKSSKPGVGVRNAIRRAIRGSDRLGVLISVTPIRPPDGEVSAAAMLRKRLRAGAAVMLTLSENCESRSGAGLS